MGKLRESARMCVLGLALGALACGAANAGVKDLVPASAGQDSPAGDTTPQTQEKDDGMVIEPAELPGTYPHGSYQVSLHARGNYVPVLHWTVEKGTLPPGIALEDGGLLHGEAQRAGEFQFVVGVRDGGQPQQAVQKVFVIKVVDALTVAWKVPAHVNVSRIEGSVEVSNATADDIDLTFDVKAVAENGRATEIGYQHFPLKKGTIGMVLPFGETLPHGTYTVRVDVNGEIAKRQAIYKAGLEVPLVLQVVPGP